MKKQIIITYEIGNDAFQTGEEIKKAILKSINNHFEYGYNSIRDINGNIVGNIEEVKINV